MARNKKKRLRGIDERYDFAASALQRTLDMVQAQIADLEAQSLCLKEYLHELPRKAQAVSDCDQGAAVRDFMDFTQAAFRQCFRTRKQLYGLGRQVMVLPKPSRN